MKIILDLCGGTGSWSKVYKESGYTVVLVTLPQYDVTKWREYPELVDIIESGNVYGILAAPPCTEFSKAKGNLPRNFKQAIEVVKACMEIVWECRISGQLKFWALENPVGFLRQFLGKPFFTFEPWWFGALHSKRTDLWGYFNAPRQKYTEPLPIIKLLFGDKSHSASWSDPKAPREYAHLKLNRAAIRAITPPEFAKAFMEANK